MHIFKSIGIAFLLMALLTGDLLAQRSGGYRSSFSSRSYSSPSRSSTPSVPRTNSSGFRSGTTSSRPSVSATPARSSVEQARYNRAAAAGTAYTSRTAAVDAFKSKYSTTYTSRYTSEPTTRPDHIPAKTNVGGQTYNVVYNQQAGGYGYTNALGTFIMYDALSDMVMLSALMDKHDYVASSPTTTSAAPSNEESSGWWLLLLLLIPVGIIVFLGIAVACE